MYNDFYYKKDRLNQLRGFCAVVQSGCSVTRAAEKLGLEHPSISKQISALERDLNVELFDRTKYKKLKLTENGKILYNRAITILQSVDSIYSDFADELKAHRESELKIASFDVILKKMIPFIAEFKKKYTKLEVSLINISKSEAFSRLINKEIDLVFYPSDINEKTPPEIDDIRVSNYASCLILPINHPLSQKKDEDITREDIANYPFGVLLDLLYTKSFKSFVEEYKLKSPLNIENGTIDFLKEMVKSNLCISVINDIYINELDKRSIIIKNTNNYLPQRFYYNFFLKNTEQKKIAKEFLDIIKQNENKIFH